MHAPTFSTRTNDLLIFTSTRIAYVVMQHACTTSYKSIFNHVSMMCEEQRGQMQPRQPGGINYSQRHVNQPAHLEGGQIGRKRLKETGLDLTLHEAAEQNRSCLLLFLHAFICQLTVTSSTWTHSALLKSWPRSRVTAVKSSKRRHVR